MVINQWMFKPYIIVLIYFWLHILLISTKVDLIWIVNRKAMNTEKIELCRTLFEPIRSVCQLYFNKCIYSHYLYRNFPNILFFKCFCGFFFSFSVNLANHLVNSVCWMMADGVLLQDVSFEPWGSVVSVLQSLFFVHAVLIRSLPLYLYPWKIYNSNNVIIIWIYIFYLILS